MEDIESPRDHLSCTVRPRTGEFGSHILMDHLDVGTLWASLHGIVRLAEGCDVRTLNPYERARLGSLKAGAIAALHLAQDDPARPESPRQPADRILFDPHLIIEEITDIAVVASAASSKPVRFHVDPSIPHGVLGDPARLRQAIWQCIQDVLFRDDVYAVEVEMLQIYRNAEHTKVRVGATAIPGEAPVEPIFATSPLDAGELDVLASLVHDIGGDLTSAAPPAAGRWITATFALPAQQATMLRNPTAEPRILVLEPDGAQQQSLLEDLQTWGCKVQLTVSPFEALQVIEAGPIFDVVIVSTAGLRATNPMARALHRECARRRMCCICTLPATHLDEPAWLPSADHVLITPYKSSELLACLGQGQRARRRPRPTRTPVILIVNDPEPQKPWIAERLRREGYETHEVGNDEGAIEALCNYPYDLVIIESDQPELYGLRIARRIRDADGPILDPWVPVFGLTGLEGSAAVQLCVRAGMDGHIHKRESFTSRALRDLVQKWLLG